MPPFDLRVTTLALLSAACAGPDGAGSGPFSPSFDPPAPPAPDRLALEPLGPQHTELDFAALMGSREHLRRTLRWGDWPRDDFTVEENRADLERHAAEFEAREAYAWSVLTPARDAVLGCVYLEPTAAVGLPGTEPSATLFLWVVEEQVAADLDGHLLDELLAWFAREWPLEDVWLLVHEDDDRGQALAASAGFRLSQATLRNRVAWRLPLAGRRP